MSRRVNLPRLFESMVSVATSGLVVIDADGIIRLANPALCAMAGVETESVIGRRCRDVLRSHRCDTDDCSLVQVERGRIPPDVWEERTTPEGIVIDCQVIVRPLLTEAGDLYGITKEIRDVSDLTKALQDLELNQQRLELAVQAGKVGVWDWDVLSGACYLSPNLKSLLGYRDHEIHNHMDDWSTHIHPADSELVELAINDHFAGHSKEFEVEHRMVHKDGSTRWFLARGRAVRDPAGKPTRMVGTDLDITDQKQGFIALARSEIRYKELFDAAPDAILLVNSSGLIVDCNEAAIALYQYRRDELIGKELSFLLLRSDQDLASIASLQRAGLLSSELEFEAVRRNGQVLEIWRKVEIRKSESGLNIGFLVYDRDITERNLVRRERQRLTNELRHNQKLESLGLLTSGVAHELNNVLASIIAIVGVIRGEIDDKPDLGEYADRIIEVCGQGSSLTKSLLGFSRRKEHSETRFCLDDIVGRTVELLQRTSPRTIEWKLDLHGDLPDLRGDRDAVSQALMNLCLNSIDAMGDEGELFIGTRRIEEPELRNRLPTPCREAVVVTIQDDGCGMDKETLDRAFEPFFTRKAGKTHGTGLGLYLVQRTLSDLGGVVSVDSRPGAGTTIELVFPVVELPASRSEATPGGLTKLLVEGDLMALVVEDEATLRGAITAFLARSGLEVLEASNGLQGARLMEKHADRIDVVILDLIMPVVDGWDCFERIRRFKPDIPVVLLTGYSTDNDRTQVLLEQPNVHLLEKPFDPEVLLAYLLDLQQKRTSIAAS